jgi:hypothetical protein
VVLVQVPETLSYPLLLPNGEFTFLSGDANGALLWPSDLSDFEVQASTNLLDWATLAGGLTFTNGRLFFIDPTAANYPERFYRVIEVQPPSGQ